MRETDPLDPAWDSVPRGGRLTRLLGRAAAAVAPHVLRWGEGRAPELRFAWGERQWRVDRDGLRSALRQGAGWEGNPRSNYNERVRKQQERGESGAPKAAAAEPPTPHADNHQAPSTEGATGDAASLGRLQATLGAEVARKMGIVESAAVATIPHGELKAEVVRLRDTLQALDDVADWDRIEAVDEDLYLLHKALEYKLRNHKASEAKARLNALFNKG